MIRFNCSQCSKRLKVDASYIGRKVRCPRCGTPLVVPGDTPNAPLEATQQNRPEQASPDQAPATAKTTADSAGSTIASSDAERVAPPASGAGDWIAVDVTSHDAQELPDDRILLLRPRGGDEDMDMTPMVDVVFLLLIFFMVTAAFSYQKTIQVPPPDSTDSVAQTRTLEEVEEEDDFIIVRIERDNTIWVEGSEAPSQQELLAKLRDARQQRGRGANTMLVVVNGDSQIEALVMALDAGTAVGLDEVRLSTTEEDDIF